VTATKARDHDFSRDLNGIILMASLEKRILDSVDDLVSNLEVLLVHLLVYVDGLDELLDMLQFSLRLNT
jgi:hypothetical protein